MAVSRSCAAAVAVVDATLVFRIDVFRASRDTSIQNSPVLVISCPVEAYSINNADRHEQDGGAKGRAKRDLAGQ